MGERRREWDSAQLGVGKELTRNGILAGCWSFMCCCSAQLGPSCVQPTLSAADEIWVLQKRLRRFSARRLFLLQKRLRRFSAAPPASFYHAFPVVSPGAGSTS